MWIESPGHCANIVSPAMKEMGAVVYGAWGVQNFGGAKAERRGSLMGGLDYRGQFIAIVAPGASTMPTITVKVDGKDRAMTHQGNGIYTLSAGSTAKCATYSFQSSNGGQVFPAQSKSLMFNCPKSYFESRGNTVIIYTLLVVLPLVLSLHIV